MNALPVTTTDVPAANVVGTVPVIMLPPASNDSQLETGSVVIEVM